MHLNDYQQAAMKTAVFDKDVALVYTTLGLTNEAGEVAGKVKKWLRKDGELNREGLIAELGDVLWYLAAVASALNEDLETIAEFNLNKLEKRMLLGTIKGDGDSR